MMMMLLLLVLLPVIIDIYCYYSIDTSIDIFCYYDDVLMTVDIVTVLY